MTVDTPAGQTISLSDKGFTVDGEYIDHKWARRLYPIESLYLFGLRQRRSAQSALKRRDTEHYRKRLRDAELMIAEAVIDSEAEVAWKAREVALSENP